MMTLVSNQTHIVAVLVSTPLGLGLESYSIHQWFDLDLDSTKVVPTTTLVWGSEGSWVTYLWIPSVRSARDRVTSEGLT